MIKNNKNEKKKLVLWLFILLALGLGLGYAVLTQKLDLDGTVNYGAMAWDVGFSSATDGGGSITSTPVISTDKKTITVSCNVGTSTKSETCISTAKIKNNSTFAVELEENPQITYDNTYINSVTVVWTATNNSVMGFDRLGADTETEIKITIKTNQLTQDLLPETSLDIPITITMDWVETRGSKEVEFADKTAIFFGDSVAYGFSTNGKGFGYYINAQESFLSYKNAAVNTATMNTTTQGTNNVINQINNNKNTQYDFVIFEGGYGDLRDTPPLGAITNSYEAGSFDTTTFAGAVEQALYLATTYWPNARIGFIISYDTPNSNYGVRPDHEATKEYWDIVKAACDKWNVPYLDFFEGSTTYNGETKTYSELFDVTGNTYLESDNIHPSAAGYEFITQFIKAWMKKLPIHVNDYNIEETEPSEPNPEDGIETDGTYTIVSSFSDLVFTKDYTQGLIGAQQEPNWKADNVGRSSAVNYIVKVNGGETIGLSASASNVTYAFAELNENKTKVNVTGSTNTTTGQTHSEWLNRNVTLQSGTKYITLSFKKGDGTTSFTDEELLLLPTYLEFK